MLLKTRFAELQVRTRCNSFVSVALMRMYQSYVAGTGGRHQRRGHLTTGVDVVQHAAELDALIWTRLDLYPCMFTMCALSR
jgi:hypothetical protein